MSDGGTPGGGNLPARRISSTELEAVIRRAVELQGSPGDADDGVTEAEVLRIGKELGLDPVSVRRAIADVRGAPVQERGVMAGLMGPGRLRVVRTVRRPAAPLGMLIEEYLLRCEYMAVQRRFPDRTRYVRATGVAASLGRAASKIGSKHPSLDLEHLEVGVSAVDEDTALVELSVDMGTWRAGFVASGAVMGGGGATAIVAAVLSTPIVDPLALLAIPVLGGVMAGVRGLYGAFSRSTREKLESFLDRVEHNELKLPGAKPDWRKQLGL